MLELSEIRFNEFEIDQTDEVNCWIYMYNQSCDTLQNFTFSFVNLPNMTFTIMGFPPVLAPGQGGTLSFKLKTTNRVPGIAEIPLTITYTTKHTVTKAVSVKPD